LIGAKINDFEPKMGVLVILLWFLAVAHISRINCANMAGDRSRQSSIFGYLFRNHFFLGW